MNFNWIDGVARNAEHPDTFEIPSDEDKAAIKPGDHIKVGGEFPGGPGERFWVLVDSVDGDIIYGVVDNDLVVLDEFIDCGDDVQVEMKNVLSIMSKK